MNTSTGGLEVSCVSTISTVGMGFMYLVNLPLMLLLGSRAMSAYKDYFRRLRLGEIRRA